MAAPPGDAPAATQPARPDHTASAPAGGPSPTDQPTGPRPGTASAEGQRLAGAGVQPRPSARPPAVGTGRTGGTERAGTERRPAPAAEPGTGTLQIAVSPWGEVEVNGRPAGTTPPMSRLELPEGRHTVTIRNADFPPYSTTVTVEADRPVVVRHRFGT
jgi:serine/threonine-protein kinase